MYLTSLPQLSAPGFLLRSTMQDDARQPCGGRSWVTFLRPGLTWSPWCLLLPVQYLLLLLELDGCGWPPFSWQFAWNWPWHILHPYQTEVFWLNSLHETACLFDSDKTQDGSEIVWFLLPLWFPSRTHSELLCVSLNWWTNVAFLHCTGSMARAHRVSGCTRFTVSVKVVPWLVHHQYVV